jgi:pSer/pThr/pTyr-binding forkhead associated (FHA) protein
MADPFRDDQEALFARLEALTAEKQRLERERDDLRSKLAGRETPPVSSAGSSRKALLRITAYSRVFETREVMIKIGRVASATLRIDHPSVARMHAIIEAPSVDNVTIIDLGSMQGTKVNGQIVHKRRLQSGDVIQLGEIEMTLAIETAP